MLPFHISVQAGVPSELTVPVMLMHEVSQSLQTQTGWVSATPPATSDRQHVGPDLSLSGWHRWRMYVHYLVVIHIVIEKGI